MKLQYLIVFLILSLFTGECLAMSPRKGGAPGRADAGREISSCNIKPPEQTRIGLKDKKGQMHFICTGQAICGGEVAPVSCRVSEREPCPIAKKCIEFGINELKSFEEIHYPGEAPIPVSSLNLIAEVGPTPSNYPFMNINISPDLVKCIKEVMSTRTTAAVTDFFWATGTDSSFGNKSGFVGGCLKPPGRHQFEKSSVCRAEHEGAIIPGQLINNKCEIAYQGKVFQKSLPFEILDGNTKYDWFMEEGRRKRYAYTTPPQAYVMSTSTRMGDKAPSGNEKSIKYQAGKDKDGKLIGICRAIYRHFIMEESHINHLYRGGKPAEGFFVGWYREGEKICRIAFGGRENLWEYEYQVLELIQ